MDKHRHRLLKSFKGKLCKSNQSVYEIDQRDLARRKRRNWSKTVMKTALIKHIIKWGTNWSIQSRPRCTAAKLDHPHSITVLVRVPPGMVCCHPPFRNSKAPPMVKCPTKCRTNSMKFNVKTPLQVPDRVNATTDRGKRQKRPPPAPAPYCPSY